MGFEFLLFAWKARVLGQARQWEHDEFCRTTFNYTLEFTIALYKEGPQATYCFSAIKELRRLNGVEWHIHDKGG